MVGKHKKKNTTTKRGPGFQKGHPGGPGRPKGSGHPTFRSVVEEIRKQHPKALEWQCPELGEVLSDPFQMAIVKTIEAAQNGESWAIKEMLDRGFGKPFQSMGIESDMPIHIHFDAKDKAL